MPVFPAAVAFAVADLATQVCRRAGSGKREMLPQKKSAQPRNRKSVLNKKKGHFATSLLVAPSLLAHCIIASAHRRAAAAFASALFRCIAS